jgi:hypothetical protein
MMQRREIRQGGYVGLVALAARAQQPSMPVIGHLDSDRAKPRKEQYPTFGKTLRDAGHIEGQTHSKAISAKFVNRALHGVDTNRGREPAHVCLQIHSFESRLCRGNHRSTVRHLRPV